MGRFLKKLFKKIEKRINDDDKQTARDKFEENKREFLRHQFFSCHMNLTDTTSFPPAQPMP